MNIRIRLITCSMALVLAGSVLFSSCSVPAFEGTSSSETEDTSVETSETSDTSETSETTEEKWSLPPVSSETSETSVRPELNGRETTPYEEIKLDGVKDHHFVATDYCFIESGKYVLFLEKDIELPGDYVVNLDAIVDEIEFQLGLSYAPADYEYSGVTDMSVCYDGFNPWENWDIGTKIPIFLIVDYKDNSLISGASGDFALFVDYELFTDELWNSVPSYRDNPWRRLGCVDYLTVAHELTHTVTGRNSTMTEIITEGIAEYNSAVVVNSLAEYYPSIGEAYAAHQPDDYLVPEAVNADNAERIFLDDYKNVSHANRGAEYVYGRRLCQFLREEYGKDFYLKYCNEVKARGLDYDYGSSDEATRKRYTEAFKTVFGNDVFTRFGKWCVKNNVLQNVG